jgi:transcriptional regulator with XRE-family HTH domain
MMGHQRILEIGQRIAAVRNHRNMTGEQLGDLIGVSRKEISAYEHGRIGPALLARLDDIARALHCKPADLLKPPDAPLPRLPRNFRFQPPKKFELNALQVAFIAAVDRMWLRAIR